MAEEKETRYISLYNNWRDYTLKDFAKKVHIFDADSEKHEKSMDEVVDALFDHNKTLIFEQMSDRDKMDFAFYKKNGKNPTYGDRYSSGYYLSKDETYYPKSADDLDKNMLIPYPCRLEIESRCITAELMVSQTNFQEQSDDYFAFQDEILSEVITEEEVTGYDASRGSMVKTAPTLTVFLWSKSNNLKKSSKGGFQLSGGASTGSADDGTRKTLVTDTSWIDISDFIISMSTNVGENGGNFQLQLPMLFNKKNKGLLDNIDSLAKDTTTFLGIVADAKEKGRGFVKENFNEQDSYSLFDQIITSNDVLFISFSDLRKNYNLESWLDSETISTIASENSFDMIGLVDNISYTKTGATANAIISVSGRDLSKLLIDDGSFFFNYSTSQDPSEVFYNEQGYEKQGDVRDIGVGSGEYLNKSPLNRMRRLGGQVDVFANMTNQNVHYIIKGVISQLANIEIVPSNTFDKWKNRTRWIEIFPEEKLVNESKSHKRDENDGGSGNGDGNNGNNTSTTFTPIYNSEGIIVGYEAK